MGRRFGWVGVTVALALAITMSACTTSSSPPVESSSATASLSSSTSPTTPSSSTSTGSATTASGIPDAAKANTPAGAEAFTKYFGGVLNAAFLDQNQDALRTLVLPECKSCSGISSSIDNYRQKGQRFVGQYINITTAVYSNESAGVTKVLAATDQTGGKVVNSDGSTVETAAPSKGNLSVQLRFDGQWRVQEMQGAA